MIWEMTNTASLDTTTPQLHFTNAVVYTQDYGAPPNAQQKPGVLLLPSALGLKEHLELVASNDDRMQQVVYADGKLWTALNSSAKTQNGPVRTTAAYFILSPTGSGETLGATVAKQGYLAINSPFQQSILFPSIGVNNNGQGVMTFTVVGQDFYPSAAYAPIDGPTLAC